MLIKNEKVVEGKKVAVLSTESKVVDNILLEAENTICENLNKFDSFEVPVNGVVVVANDESTFADMKADYLQTVGN